MDFIFLSVTFAIQAIAVIMVIYTFHKISEQNFPKLASMERYHLMRKRYEHLRWSLLFVGALITIQLIGVFTYVRTGIIPLTQLLVSDAIVIALVIFLTRIYRVREHLQDFDLTQKNKK